MKIVLFDEHRPGVLRGDEVIDVADKVEAGRTGQETLVNLLASWSSLKPVFEEQLASGKGVPLASVRLRAPVPWPTKIMCMASNYREGTDLPPRPIRGFLAPPTAILDPGGVCKFPALEIKTWQHEAELVAVIAKEGKDVPESEALDYIFGYTTGVDVSPRTDHWGFLTKCFDGHKPIGPCIVTTDEIPDPSGIQVQLSVDGVLRQDYNTRDMGHPIAECISWFSSFMTLLPGDLLFFGTNHQQLGPLQDGESIEMGADKVGKFTFTISDPMKRSWPKELDPIIAAGARERLARDAGVATGN